MGLETRFAGDIAIGIGVTGLNQEVETFSRLEIVGRKLIDVNGANTLVLGCAGMARYRVPLQDRLGVTVIDPAQAAVAMAISAVQLEHTNKSFLNQYN